MEKLQDDLMKIPNSKHNVIPSKGCVLISFYFDHYGKGIHMKSHIFCTRDQTPIDWSLEYTEIIKYTFGGDLKKMIRDMKKDAKNKNPYDRVFHVRTHIPSEFSYENNMY